MVGVTRVSTLHTQSTSKCQCSEPTTLVKVIFGCLLSANTLGLGFRTAENDLLSNQSRFLGKIKGCSKFIRDVSLALFFDPEIGMDREASWKE